MVNNSPILKKTNNHLSHQLTEHNKYHMTLEIQVHAQKYGGVKSRDQPSPQLH
jgi:hypothetical protein